MSPRFASLVETHADDVYGYLAYRLGSRAAAERLTRATFERASRRGSALGRGPREERLSLLAIARHLAAVNPPNADVDGDGGAGFSPDLARALDGLRQRERAVLSLRYGARLTRPEVARLLELSEDRVRSALSSGLRRLRTELERQQRDNGEQPHA